jgi:hypothetical protein
MLAGNVTVVKGGPQPAPRGATGAFNLIEEFEPASPRNPRPRGKVL